MCRQKLVPSLERLAREKDDYVRGAVEALRSEAALLVPAICAGVAEELGRPGSRRPPALSSSPKQAAAAAQKAPLAQFQIVLHLLTAPLFRAVVVTPALIADLASFLAPVASVAPSGAPGGAGAGGAAAGREGLPEFRDALLNALEAVCQQAELLVAHAPAVLEHLLPAFCAVIAASDSGDTRFFCLRMASDAVQLLVTEPSLYVAPGERGGAPHALAASAAAIDRAVEAHVLPQLPQLLRDEDPMPLYALKVRTQRPLIPLIARARSFPPLSTTPAPSSLSPQPFLHTHAKPLPQFNQLTKP